MRALGSFAQTTLVKRINKLIRGISDSGDYRRITMIVKARQPRLPSRPSKRTNKRLKRIIDFYRRSSWLLARYLSISGVEI
jgi:hypothetical protein